MGDAKRCDIERRKLIVGAGTLAAGAALLSAGIPNFVATARAAGVAKYPYKKLDVNEVGRIAYENYFTKFCGETCMTGLFQPLQSSVGEPYTSFPLHALFWTHGGLMGWGTACGTLLGSGMAVALITGEDKAGEAIINDIISYYANTELPTYKPAKALKADIKNISKSDSPLCHISVGRWMKKENVKFFTDPRLERCARLSANIAMYTAQLLNEWADGTYKPRNKPLANVMDNQIPVMNNCGDCHGGNVPNLPGA